MKKIYKIAIVIFIFSLFTFHSFSQDITADTTLANENYEKAIKHFSLHKFDSAMFYAQKAQKLYPKHLGENTNFYAEILNVKGTVYFYWNMLDSALICYEKVKNIFKKTRTDVSNINHNIGLVYNEKNEFDKSISIFEANLNILKKDSIKNQEQIIITYNSIAESYVQKGEYNKALIFYMKAFEISIKIFDEKSTKVAYSYNNIGGVYWLKEELFKAAEYFKKSIDIKSVILPENHISFINAYNNLGSVYNQNQDYDKAINYFFKSRDLCNKIFGEKSAKSMERLSNIGAVYMNMQNYNAAMEYFNKCINIGVEIFGEYDYSLIDTYSNMAQLYFIQNQFSVSEFYLNKALKIIIQNQNNKNEKSASLFYSLAKNNSAQNKHNYAIKNLQKAVSYCLYGYNDTINNFTVPMIHNYLYWSELLIALQAKAQIFANDTIQLPDFNVKDGIKTRYQIALKHYQACDTLINQVRKEITMLPDKIALGEKANQVYNEAVEVCLKLSKVAPKDSVDYYKKLAFEYSEKNKSSVLLESLAGAQAMQFAGIPDSLLEKEHNLQIDIALYKRLLSEQPDSAQEANFRDRLFKANRNYEELIQQFEKNYTQYYNLKYGQNLANVSQLQQTLDKTTAIISYQETDSVLFIFYIEKNNYHIYTTPIRSNYQEIISVFRQSLVNTAPNNAGLNKAAHFLYKQLFPFTIESHIQNLIVIPEGSMCLIPFEALLTEEYKGNPEQYSNYAYLVKKYNISYAYSASLFYRTFPKTPTKKVEVTQLNDWLAIAPVFDDVKTGGASFRTRQLLRDMEKIKTDTITTRAFMLTGEYITPLPGTESEVKNIFNKFENKNKKAQIQLHAYANEAFVKSEEIKKYKYLHFASHGIVNMQKPELSGIILAQDSTSGEDGILYSGEIYNLKLNADLTVLSACETGLGEIKKGEGLIGLTRALLYAGSKNIIVSLWKVADNSTSQLMVDFYDNLLKNESNNMNYSNALRQAKLKMIAKGKYSHPFYWSPFILVGK